MPQGKPISKFMNQSYVAASFVTHSHLLAYVKTLLFMTSVTFVGTTLNMILK